MPYEAKTDPEAMYDRLATLTAEMSDEQRHELAELLLSGDVDSELLAFVLRDQAGDTVASDVMPALSDQATVESDGAPPDLGMTNPAMMAQDLVRYDAFHAQAAQSEPLAPEAIETVESAPKHLTLGEMDDDTWGGVEAGWELLLDGAWRDFDAVDHAVITHPGNHCLPIRPRAPKYRDDTRLLQCCGVARLIGHRAGCAEVS